MMKMTALESTDDSLQSDVPRSSMNSEIVKAMDEKTTP